tara:strand:- start:342 stop:755 length:414 start_codon:yes stop_codon:yes gene_type:complete
MILQETSLSYSYPSTQGTFKFSVSANKYGSISVSSVTKDNIAFLGSYPVEVQRAINEAISKLEVIMSNISTLSGTITFANQSESSVFFDAPMPNTDYRVLFSVGDFIFARVKSKSTTGFLVELSTSFTGDVKYDVII